MPSAGQRGGCVGFHRQVRTHLGTALAEHGLGADVPAHEQGP